VPQELRHAGGYLTKHELMDALAGLADFGEAVTPLQGVGTDRMHVAGLGVADVVPVQQCDLLALAAADGDDDTDAQLVRQHALVALDVDVDRQTLPVVDCLEGRRWVFVVGQASVPPRRLRVAVVVWCDWLFRRLRVGVGVRHSSRINSPSETDSPISLNVSDTAFAAVEPFGILNRRLNAPGS